MTSVLLALIFWQWRTMPGVVWEVENAVGRAVLQGLFWAGWLILLTSTYLINHFELFGLQQVYRICTDRNNKAQVRDLASPQAHADTR